MTCLYIASKTEDTLKKLHFLIQEYLLITIVGSNKLEIESSQMEKEKKRFFGLEMKILEILHFQFKIPNPYIYCRKMSKQLGLSYKVCHKAYETITDS